MKKAALAAGVFLLTFNANSWSADSPLDAFHNQLSGASAHCQAQGQIGIMKIQLGQKDAWIAVRECAAAAKTDAKATLQTALSFVNKKPKAVSAVKDFYVAWVSSLDVLELETEDTEDSWKSRQNAAARRTKEAWTRVELEL